MKQSIKYSFFLLTLLFISCSEKEMTYSNVEEMLLKNKEKTQLISITDLKTHLDEEKQFLLIDCREQEEFVEGHISGAVNVPRGILEFSPKVSNRRIPIYVYSQGVQRAVLSASTLAKLKHRGVKVVDGGWDAWIEKYPDSIEKGLGENQKEAPPQEEDGGCGS